MNNARPNMFIPALIGGAAAGVLSGLPYIQCLCCLWIIGGAMLSAYLLSKESTITLSIGDGAIVGILSGIIAAVVDTIVSIPFLAKNAEIMRNIVEKFVELMEEVPPNLESYLQQGSTETSFAITMLGLLMRMVVFAAFGALGGIIGISIFKKKPSQIQQGVHDAPKDTSHNQS